MQRSETARQGQTAKLVSLVGRFSGLALALVSMAIVATSSGWTDTSALKGAAGLHSAQRAPHGPGHRRLGGLGGLRHEDLQAYWSGYAMTNGAFTSMTATWNVAAVKYVAYPSSPAVESTSTWIGIGGDPTPVLIQLGTEQDVTKDNIALYTVWYELYPADSFNIDATRFAVNPGDMITATMQCIAPSPCVDNKPSTWIITLADGNRWKFSMQVQNPPPNIATFNNPGNDNPSTNLDTAEWIMEAPCESPCSNLYDYMSYLPNFGTTTFSGLSVNGQPPKMNKFDNGLMVTDPHGKAWSMPSELSSDNSFTLTYVQPPQH